MAAIAYMDAVPWAAGPQASVLWLIGSVPELSEGVGTLLDPMESSGPALLALADHRRGRSRAVAAKVRTPWDRATMHLENSITVQLGSTDVYADQVSCGRDAAEGIVGILLSSLSTRTALLTVVPATSHPTSPLARSALNMVTIAACAAACQDSSLRAATETVFRELVGIAAASRSVVVSPIAPEFLGRGVAVVGSRDVVEAVHRESIGHSVNADPTTVRRSVEMDGYLPR